MSDDLTIRNKKINSMKVKIIQAEQTNLKTREKNRNEMIETLKRIIQDEAKKVY